VVRHTCEVTVAGSFVIAAAALALTALRTSGSMTRFTCQHYKNVMLKVLTKFCWVVMEFASGAKESGKKTSFMVLRAKAAIVDVLNITPGQKQFNLQAERQASFHT
jgi:hypothetical protein